jgi:hypothetical protein
MWPLRPRSCQVLLSLLLVLCGAQFFGERRAVINTTTLDDVGQYVLSATSNTILADAILISGVMQV